MLLTLTAYPSDFTDFTLLVMESSRKEEKSEILGEKLAGLFLGANAKNRPRRITTTTVDRPYMTVDCKTILFFAYYTAASGSYSVLIFAKFSNYETPWGTNRARPKNFFTDIEWIVI